jgi:hypothetical protein
MVTSILVIVLVLGIAFYHFTEGFFTALISAISAVLAAVLAVSYTEPVVTNVFHGALADCIHAFTLMLLFVVGYVIIRMTFDKLIPGNVRTPATLDKIAAAVMGLVAGTFAVGIFVIALQMLPFNAPISFFGYTRFPVTSSRHVYVHYSGNKNDDDSIVNDQMIPDSLDPEKETNHLIYPADDLVMNTVYHLSDGGSLAGSRSLASVHPDWLGELFGERLGEQTGNRRSALVTATNNPITVAGVFRGDGLPTFDGYGNTKRSTPPDMEIRPPGYKQPHGDTLTSKGSQVYVVVRIKVRSSATDDTDKLFRFSPAMIRLTLRQPNAAGDFGPGKDYNPVAFVEDGKAVTTRIDDFLFENTGDASGFDAVFLLDKSALVGGKNKAPELAPGTFITIKRLANIDLSGMSVGDSVPPDPGQKLMWSDAIKSELHPDPH